MRVLVVPIARRHAMVRAFFLVLLLACFVGCEDQPLVRDESRERRYAASYDDSCRHRDYQGVAASSLWSHPSDSWNQYYAPGGCDGLSYHGGRECRDHR